MLFVVLSTGCQWGLHLWMCALTRSMLSSGLALLRIRIICLIWLWLTLLLMQPNTTSALGWRDGLYWNANLESKHIQTWWGSKLVFTTDVLKQDWFGGWAHTFVQALSIGLTTCTLGCLSYKPEERQHRVKRLMELILHESRWQSFMIGK